MKDYRLAVFSKSLVFGHFPIGTLDKLADACETVDIQPGEFLFHDGDIPSDLLIIDEGKVELVKRVSGSRGLVLALLIPGDIVEVNSFMDGCRHFVSAIAVAPTRVIKIPMKKFMDVMTADAKTEHRVLHEILKVQSAGIRTLNARFNEFLSKAAT